MVVVRIERSCVSSVIMSLHEELHKVTDEFKRW